MLALIAFRIAESEDLPNRFLAHLSQESRRAAVVECFDNQRTLTAALASFRQNRGYHLETLDDDGRRALASAAGLPAFPACPDRGVEGYVLARPARSNPFDAPLLVCTRHGFPRPPAKGRAREQLAALGVTDEALLGVCATSHPSADSLPELLEAPSVAVPLAICVAYCLVKLYLYLG